MKADELAEHSDARELEVHYVSCASAHAERRLGEGLISPEFVHLRLHLARLQRDAVVPKQAH